MSQITKNLYLGSYKEARDQNQLKKKNIKGVLVAAKYLQSCFLNDFEYIYFPLDDNSTQSIYQQLGQGIKFIDKFVQKDQNVFVHCYKGKSRSSSFVIAYLMFKIKDLTFNEALKYLQQIRPIVNPNQGFQLQLMIFEDIIEHYYLLKSSKENEENNFSDYQILDEAIKSYKLDYKILAQKFPQITAKRFMDFQKNNQKFIKDQSKSQEEIGKIEKMKNSIWEYAYGFGVKVLGEGDIVQNQNEEINLLKIPLKQQIIMDQYQEEEKQDEIYFQKNLDFDNSKMKLQKVENVANNQNHDQKNKLEIAEKVEILNINEEEKEINIQPKEKIEFIQQK